MAHRRGSFRGRSFGISESQRRKKSWLGFADAGSEVTGNLLEIPDIAGAAGSSLVVSGITSPAAAQLGLLEGTIMRIRGSIEVPKSTISNVATKITVAYGIGFVTDEAFAVSAVPNPATPEGADWDGWLFYRAQLQGSLDANAGIVDSKAMRKWQSGMTFVQVAGQATDLVGGTTAQNVATIFRGLFLLP